jgi:transcriptional regulator with XRE-family HTH domain
MLPFCDRHVSVPRKDVAPVWTRSFPISKEPKTLGQHLRKKRFEMGMRQVESALKLGVTCKTLSDWETDRIYPSLTMQTRLVEYLGYDPFIIRGLGTLKGNETLGVAFLSPDGTLTQGQRIRYWRMGLKKTRKKMAAELGICAKTLWGWENDLSLPTFAINKLSSRGFVLHSE